MSYKVSASINYTRMGQFSKVSFKDGYVQCTDDETGEVFYYPQRAVNYCIVQYNGNKKVYGVCVSISESKDYIVEKVPEIKNGFLHIEDGDRLILCPENGARVVEYYEEDENLNAKVKNVVEIEPEDEDQEIEPEDEDQEIEPEDEDPEDFDNNSWKNKEKTKTKKKEKDQDEDEDDPFFF